MKKAKTLSLLTYRHVLQPRIGLNVQNMKEYNKISVLQIGGALTRNFYAEVNSNKHGTCVSSNWVTIYYDILIGMGNKGPLADSTFMPKATKEYYRFTPAELRSTGWRFGMSNRGNVFGKGSLWRIEFGMLPGFAKSTVTKKDNTAFYIMFTAGFGWSKKIKFIDKL